MKNAKALLLSVFFVCLSVVTHANAQRLNTEEAELVCQMNDYVGTRVFVDSDTVRDREIGKLSAKVLEMSTVNTYANNNRLFKVRLLSVSRARCPGCQNNQIILYKSVGDDETIVKLETSNTAAKITRGVSKTGVPLRGAVVEQGVCEANEPY